MKIKIRNFAITIIILAAVIGLGAYGLHFVMPDAGYKTLLGISTVLAGLVYVIIKISSVIIKLILAAVVVGAIIFFLV